MSLSLTLAIFSLVLVGYYVDAFLVYAPSPQKYGGAMPLNPANSGEFMKQLQGLSRKASELRGKWPGSGGGVAYGPDVNYPSSSSKLDGAVSYGGPQQLMLRNSAEKTYRDLKASLMRKRPTAIEVVPENAVVVEPKSIRSAMMRDCLFHRSGCMSNAARMDNQRTMAYLDLMSNSGLAA